MAVTDQATWRIVFFAATLLVMASWEWFMPRHHVKRLPRWPTNFSILLLGNILGRLAAPLGAAGFAELCRIRGWGILNFISTGNSLLLVVASVIAFDFLIYLQHLTFHKIDWLWRLHRVHHSDLNFDVSTALRFHPIEILLSIAIKFLAVFVLGPPAIAILIFEILLNMTSIFNHSNISLPWALDRILRFLIVTPGYHRIHHSTRHRDMNSNFGFNLPWWDRLLGTYRDEPEGGQQMIVGLKEFRTPEDQGLGRLLTQPFIRTDD